MKKTIQSEVGELIDLQNMGEMENVQEKMIWRRIDREPLVDELRVLLCCINKHIYIGVRDEYGFYDDNCQELYDIVWWAYLPEPPYFYDTIITNDEWVTLAMKQKSSAFTRE